MSSAFSRRRSCAVQGEAGIPTVTVVSGEFIPISTSPQTPPRDYQSRYSFRRLPDMSSPCCGSWQTRHNAAGRPRIPALLHRNHLDFTDPPDDRDPDIEVMPPKQLSESTDAVPTVRF